MVRTWAIYPKLGYGMVLTWERTQALQDSRSYISRYIRRYQKARGPCQLLEEVRGGEGRVARGPGPFDVALMQRLRALGPGMFLLGFRV